MSDAAPTKTSFSLGAAKPKKKVAQNNSNFDGQPVDDDEKPAAAESVSEMVDGQVDGKKERVRVIPAQQNTFTLGGAQHLRGQLENKPGSGSAAADDGESSAAAEPAENAASASAPAAAAAPPVSEDAAAAQSILAELRAGGSSIFANGSGSAPHRRR